MAKKNRRNDRIVYSTDAGRIDAPDTPSEYPASPDRIIRLRRETKGRGGKTVTTVNGVGGSESELKALAKILRKACGSGGSVKDGVIVIQGDHRDTLRAAIEAEGYRVKMAGG